MIILPAIDIKDRRCVRLYKGDFATAEQVAPDPLAAARGFEAAGARWLHMVDLDGAKERRPVNADIFKLVAKETSLKIELGGGIRDMQTVEDYLSHGIERVILGSAALEDPALVREAVSRFGGRIAVGIDARDGCVAANGWLERSEVGYLDLAREMERAGVRTIIYTDIGRDGTLEGANLGQLEALKNAVGCDIVASGGVRDIGDIAALHAMGLYGAICGKSIYQGTLDLREALQTARER